MRVYDYLKFIVINYTKPFRQKVWIQSKIKTSTLNINESHFLVVIIV